MDIQVAAVAENLIFDCSFKLCQSILVAVYGISTIVGLILLGVSSNVVNTKATVYSHLSAELYHNVYTYSTVSTTWGTVLMFFSILGFFTAMSRRYICLVGGNLILTFIGCAVEIGIAVYGHVLTITANDWIQACESCSNRDESLRDLLPIIGIAWLAACIHTVGCIIGCVLINHQEIIENYPTHPCHPTNTCCDCMPHKTSDNNNNIYATNFDEHFANAKIQNHSLGHSQFAGNSVVNSDSVRTDTESGTRSKLKELRRLFKHESPIQVMQYDESPGETIRSFRINQKKTPHKRSSFHATPQPTFTNSTERNTPSVQVVVGSGKAHLNIDRPDSQGFLNRLHAKNASLRSNTDSLLEPEIRRKLSEDSVFKNPEVTYLTVGDLNESARASLRSSASSKQRLKSDESSFRVKIRQLRHSIRSSLSIKPKPQFTRPFASESGLNSIYLSVSEPNEPVKLHHSCIETLKHNTENSNVSISFRPSDSSIIDSTFAPGSATEYTRNMGEMLKSVSDGSYWREMAPDQSISISCLQEITSDHSSKESDIKKRSPTKFILMTDFVGDDTPITYKVPQFSTTIERPIEGKLSPTSYSCPNLTNNEVSDIQIVNETMTGSYLGNHRAVRKLGCDSDNQSLTRKGAVKRKHGNHVVKYNSPINNDGYTRVNGNQRHGDIVQPQHDGYITNVYNDIIRDKHHVYADDIGEVISVTPKQLRIVSPDEYDVSPPDTDVISAYDMVLKSKEAPHKVYNESRVPDIIRHSDDVMHSQSHVNDSRMYYSASFHGDFNESPRDSFRLYKDRLRPNSVGSRPTPNSSYGTPRKITPHSRESYNMTSNVSNIIYDDVINNNASYTGGHTMTLHQSGLDDVYLCDVRERVNESDTFRSDSKHNSDTMRLSDFSGLPDDSLGPQFDYDNQLEHCIRQMKILSQIDAELYADDVTDYEEYPIEVPYGFMARYPRNYLRDSVRSRGMRSQVSQSSLESGASYGDAIMGSLNGSHFSGQSLLL